jgi:hypothetical protein
VKRAMLDEELGANLELCPVCWRRMFCVLRKWQWYACPTCGSQIKTVLAPAREVFIERRRPGVVPAQPR